MIAIWKKELRSYFLTPGGYVFMGAFLFVAGLMFSVQNLFTGSKDYANYLGGLIFVFLLVVPILTMKLFTEEKRQNTETLLLSSPVSVAGIVVGKYLAAMTVFMMTLLVTMLYPLFLSFHGTLDWALIWGTYVGFLFLGASFIAIGTFLSEVAESQTSAAILTFCGLFASWIIDFARGLVPTTSFSGALFLALVAGLFIWMFYSKTKEWRISVIALAVCAAAVIGVFLLKADLYYGLISKFLGWFSLTSRFQRFSMGILKLDAIVYYVSFSACFLYLTGNRIENRRWS